MTVKGPAMQDLAIVYLFGLCRMEHPLNGRFLEMSTQKTARPAALLPMTVESKQCQSIAAGRVG
jgi:hypothetical protein